MANDNNTNAAKIRQLNKDIKKANEQIAVLSNENTIINDKINRLKATKTVLTNEKDNYFIIKTYGEFTINDKYSWKGWNYTAFQNNGSNLIYENEQYYNSLDHTLDSINDEITRLKCMLDDKNGLIGDISKLIRRARTKIENLCN